MTIQNQPDIQKQASYAFQKSRYKNALKHEYYYECIFIDYALIEDRILSILSHLGIADISEPERPEWKTYPKARKKGYKNVLQPICTKSGSLPLIRNLSSKVGALQALLSTEEPSTDMLADGEYDYECWLRTAVRRRLAECELESILSRLDSWRHDRNVLTHALLSSKAKATDTDKLRALAEEGMDLANSLDSISGKMKTCMGRYERKRIEKKKSANRR